MPNYEITLPDGRTMRATASSPEEAEAGARNWWAEQQRAARPAEPEPVADPIPPRAIDPAGFPAQGEPAADPALTKAPIYDELSSEPFPAQGELAAAPGKREASSVDFADRAGNAFMFNWGDELAAALGSGFGIGPRIGGKSRQEILDDFRKRQDAYAARDPEGATTAEGIGALGSLVMPGAATSRLIGEAPGLLRALGIGTLAAVPPAALDATGRMEGPHTAGEYAGNAADAAGRAMAYSAAASTAGQGVGRVVGPWASRLGQYLTERGVQLTPGEVLGGIPERIERHAGAVPVIGDMIRGRAREGIESLNRAAYENVLQPLGRRYQQVFNRAAPEVGHDAINEMEAIFNRRYGAVVPRMQAVPDADLTTDVARIRQGLPHSARPEFDDAYQRYATDVADPTTRIIPGSRLQQSLRSLREASRRYRQSTADPTHHDFGVALGELRDALEANAARHSAPRDVTAFRNINAGYRRFAVARDAASRVGADEGVFTPSVLHSAVRAQDRTAGKAATARGQSVLQDLSGPARSVMRTKGAGSQTAERLGLAALVGGILKAPEVTLGTVAAAAPLAALYSRPGVRAFQHLATFRPETRMMIRRAIERVTAAGGPMVGNEMYNEGF